MKKTILFLVILFFFCSFNGFATVSKIAFASQDKQVVFVAGEKTFKFSFCDFKTKEKQSNIQQKILQSNSSRFEVLKQTQNFGLSQKEQIDYVFPEFKKMIDEVCQKTNIPETPCDVQVVLNKCKIKFKPGSAGFYVDLNHAYQSFFNQIKSGKNFIKIILKIKSFKKDCNLMYDFVEKACFSTNFSTSSKERKNNIKLALSKFDALVLESGEKLSFNSVTGKRTKEQGYSEAKIISGGTFVNGFGGGVCQVSTTLYNACLLAGLEIVEVHPHSLPVSYVEPCFDAMVNMGSSDLVVKNNTDGKLIITTSSENDVCKVKIFGKKNKFKINRKSEKFENIEPEEKTVCYAPEKFGITDMLPGEEKRLSYAKPGYKAKGYLEFCDENWNVIQTKKIRENTYLPVKGVVVKKEN